MAYVKKIWVNGVDVADKTNLDHLETQYDEAIAVSALRDGSAAYTGTGAGFRDEDSMASDDATAPASQQSIVAYVAAQISVSAGDILLQSADTIRTKNGGGTSDVYEMKKEIQLPRPGTYRIKFAIEGSGAGVDGYGRIYRNGGAVGTERIKTGASYTTFSEDIDGWTDGDLCQLYCRTGIASQSMNLKEFRIYAGSPEISTVNTD